MFFLQGMMTKQMLGLHVVLMTLLGPLGIVYTMDHEVVPMLCKICDWLLKLSWDHFGLNQGKVVRVTMEFEVPRRHNLRLTLSTDMVQRVWRWERQKGCTSRKRQGPMIERYYYYYYYLGKRR
jgi:hypothetical protein